MGNFSSADGLCNTITASEALKCDDNLFGAFEHNMDNFITQFTTTIGNARTMVQTLKTTDNYDDEDDELNNGLSILDSIHTKICLWSTVLRAMSTESKQGIYGKLLTVMKENCVGVKSQEQVEHLTVNDVLTLLAVPPSVVEDTKKVTNLLDNGDISECLIFLRMMVAIAITV